MTCLLNIKSIYKELKQLQLNKDRKFKYIGTYYYLNEINNDEIETNYKILSLIHRKYKFFGFNSGNKSLIAFLHFLKKIKSKSIFLASLN